MVASTQRARGRWRRPKAQKSSSTGVLLSACVLAIGVVCGRCWACGWPVSTQPLVAARARNEGSRLALQATRTSSKGAKPATKASPRRERTLIPTAEAPFLTAAEQPLVLSPNGARAARFELGDDGMQLRVEAAPAFGPQGSVTAVATARDVVERVVIIPRQDLGVKGVVDLFWLDDRCFLITGFDGYNGRYYGWIADLNSDQATAIPMPTQESSLFVPLGEDGLPLARRDEKGGPELLLGFTSPSPEEGGQPIRSWAWYSVSTNDLEDAAVNEELPTKLWREAILSQFGQVEALLLVNGSVHRRSPDGWLGLGTISLAALEGDTALSSPQTVLPRNYLVSAGPDYSVFAIDTLRPGSLAPQTTPPLEDLIFAAGQTEDLPPSGSNIAAWVLQQSQQRQTSALVHMTAAEDAVPLPLFAHPFADVSLSGVWVDPETDCPEAVAVEDLKAHAYALRPASGLLLADLKKQLPEEVQLHGVRVPSSELEPLFAHRRGERWVVFYKQPAMQEPWALPVLVKGGNVEWIGDTSLPFRGGALSARAAAVHPRVEGHRLQSGKYDIPVYLVLPEKDPSALVLRTHEGPQQRFIWGADGLDAWLLSRGYGVLKVNHRGSSGFGRAWATEVTKQEGGFLDDLQAATAWALEDRQVIPGVSLGKVGMPPPVAVMGKYFGGYAALQAMLHHHGSLFACGIAIAPTQVLQHWPDNYIPNAAVRQEVEALRKEAASEADGADPAAAVLAPSARAADLSKLPLLLVEFERDMPDAKGDLLQQLTRTASSPDEWPRSVTLLQYAGEGRGGGVVRQNGLDQHKRIDSFLYRHLSPVALALGERPLQREPFTDELPFLSGALLPATRGDLSETARAIEQAFEERFRQLDPELAASFPNLYQASSKPSRGGFSSSPTRTKGTKRKALVSPRARISLREEGAIIEIHVAFDEEPQGLHALLSEVWFHIRAQGVGFTIHLPRQPLRGVKVGVSRLPGEGSFVFEISADPSIGAVENYQAWASAGAIATIMSVVTPQDIAAAPMDVLEA